MKFILSLIIFYSLSVHAGKGIVTVLEAPILRSPEIDSQVVQLIRKGQKVYIHDKHFAEGPDDPQYLRTGDLEKLGLPSNHLPPDFYLTIDRNGRDAYIPQEYIKLIYQDKREFTQSPTPFSPDPTDYRQEEPLPEGYPIVKKNHYRANIAFSLGQDIKTSYAYTRPILEENFSQRLGMRVSYLRKAAWDKEDRFYFGANFHFLSSEATFTLFDFSEATESRGQIGIGPIASYDVWRSDNYEFSISGAITLNYNRLLITQLTSLADSEQRAFSGLSFTPKVSSLFQIKEVFPSIDFVIGVEAQFFLPTNLRSGSPVVFESIWNEEGTVEDQFNIPFSANLTSFIGIQSHY